MIAFVAGCRGSQKPDGATAQPAATGSPQVPQSLAMGGAKPVGHGRSCLVRLRRTRHQGGTLQLHEGGAFCECFELRPRHLWMTAQAEAAVG